MRNLAVCVILLSTLAFASGCKKKVPPPVETPAPETAATADDTPDAAPAPSASATAPAAHAATGPAPCKMALKVGTLASSGGITDPDLSSNSTSTLVFPCAGGTAHAQFGKHSFAGTADKTKVNLLATSTYTAFGCPWTTTQTITGAPPALHYSYTEHVAAGCKSNAKPSTISGPVSAL